MNPSTCEISDRDWEMIQKVLPNEIYKGHGSLGGRPHADLRRTFCGILHFVRSGCQWDLVPKCYGARSTLEKYFAKWVHFGSFDQLMTESLELYDRVIGIKWKFQPIDGSIKRAPGCSAGAGENPTDRVRPGVKHMILTDQKGILLAATIIPANETDMKNLETTLQEIRTKRPDPRKVEQHILADKGFDSDENREISESWGYHHHIREKGEGWARLKTFTPKRWVVERTHSWLNQFRGIYTRRVHNPDFYQAMLLLACSCVILSKL
jgi:putative transposase